jgi:hypothetical protein
MGVDPAAIATEVRLGRLHRENATDKAMRLLVEGRVQIRSCGPEGGHPLDATEVRPPDLPTNSARLLS